MIESHVDSSNLLRVGWDEGTLYIEFHGRPQGSPGRVYAYDNVPMSQYTVIVEAESAGKAFNGNVKGRYEYRQIKTWPELVTD